MLEVKNLNIDNILNDISFNAKEGEILGIIGLNGSGKSSILKSIMNLTYFDGEILFNNLKIDKKFLKNSVGYIPDDMFIKNVTVSKLFIKAQKLYKKDCSEKLNYLIKKLDIDVTKKIDDLSAGNLKKIEFVLAFMHEPKLVILDNPTSNLDPIAKEKIYKLLMEEKKKTTTILVSQDLDLISILCDEVVIIKNGKISKKQRMRKLKSSIYDITIKADNITKENLPLKNMVVNSMSKDEINFIYTGSISDLFKKLSKIEIENIIIKEPSLMESFKHYFI